MFKIKVNGTDHHVHECEITYEEVVKLAFPEDKHADFVYTVTYTAHHLPDGSLAEGQKPVELHHEHKVKFHVNRTNRS